MENLLKAQRGTQTTEMLSFVMEQCITCGVPFMMPKYMKRALEESENKFYCPNGHNMFYNGQSEAKKLKDQLETERKDHERWMENLNNKYLDEISAKNKLAKQLKRVHNGVCPCCNRSFANLERHMKTKHPEVAGKDIPNKLHNKINSK